MKKIMIFFVALLLTYSNDTHAQSNPPKREFRGAWIATVANLDWPSTPNLSEEQQRIELLRIFDELHEAGINAVFLQIRPESDAFYRSEIEPWSYWLTGQQGKAPADSYDPLEFAIDEAHDRGMELHAWFNLYRAVRSIGSYAIDSLHVSIRHPEWLLTFGTFQILDPGLPLVREYITNVIMDVVRRYDIDGVHFDDFFYPYPPNQIVGQDLVTFQNHNRGFTDIGDWRRDNVNLFVEMVNDSIKATRPHVKFGVSPFGIWKNGEPPGIVGLDAYNVIYADPLAWLGKEIVDYVAPQLYWPFGGSQDYGTLQPWWAAQSFVRHIYIGQAVFKISDWPAGEMQNQLALNRSNPDVRGSLFFRSLFFRQNPRGFTDYLRTDQYRYLALPPLMPWKDAIPPDRPQNIRYERIAGTGTAALQWDMPEIAVDGDTALRFVLYRFETANVQQSDLENPDKIVAVKYSTFAMPETPQDVANSYFYVVTALDRIANESVMSAVLEIRPPSVPLLAFPDDTALNQPQGVEIAWHYPPVASSYHVQVSQDSMFSETILVDEEGIVDTMIAVFDMEGQQTYFW
ncbi:MAG: family 10 glycosylhydrolase, partial [bacterium]